MIIRLIPICWSKCLQLQGRKLLRIQVYSLVYQLVNTQLLLLQVVLGLFPVVQTNADCTASAFTAAGARISVVFITEHPLPEVTVTGSGGTGTGFKFSEDNVEYFDSNVFYVVADVAKTLKYYVKDSNGCVAFHEITIPAFPSLIAADVTFGDLMDCVNNKQVMNVAITGGTNTPEKFTYQAYKNGLPYGPLNTVDGRDFVFNAPDADCNYQFEIFDNNTTCSI